MKYLLWTIIFIGIALFTRMLTHHNARQRSEHIKKRNKASKKPVTNEAEPMVRCAHCSIHLPRSEAVLSGGKTWCCIEHSKLGAGK